MKHILLHDDQKGPTFYWGIDGHDQAPARIIPLIKALTNGAPFRLTAFMADDWSSDYSPWSAPPAFGKQPFAGKGRETLAWLTHLISASPAQKPRFIVGYSLAGLFALWAHCETNLFNGAASCSGSLWFPAWIDYLKQHAIDASSAIYLSLGDAEEHTKNALMRQVGDNTRLTFSRINQQCKATLEWNTGGHFNAPLMRTAKGMAWLIGVCERENLAV